MTIKQYPQSRGTEHFRLDLVIVPLLVVVAGEIGRIPPGKRLPTSHIYYAIRTQNRPAPRRETSPQGESAVDDEKASLRPCHGGQGGLRRAAAGVSPGRRIGRDTSPQALETVLADIAEEMTLDAIVRRRCEVKQAALMASSPRATDGLQHMPPVTTPTLSATFFVATTQGLTAGPPPVPVPGAVIWPPSAQ